MTTKPAKLRPDVIEVASRVLQEATGEAERTPPPAPSKQAAKQAPISSTYVRRRHPRLSYGQGVGSAVAASSGVTAWEALGTMGDRLRAEVEVPYETATTALYRRGA